MRAATKRCAYAFLFVAITSRVSWRIYDVKKQNYAPRMGAFARTGCASCFGLFGRNDSSPASANLRSGRLRVEKSGMHSRSHRCNLRCVSGWICSFGQRMCARPELRRAGLRRRKPRVYRSQRRHKCSLLNLSSGILSGRGRQVSGRRNGGLQDRRSEQYCR